MLARRSSHGAVSRRTLLLGAGAGGAAVVGGAGYALLPDRLRNRLPWTEDPYIPDAPEGVVRLETVRSEARGRDVDLFTAVPPATATGPVCRLSWCFTGAVRRCRTSSRSGWAGS